MYPYIKLSDLQNETFLTHHIYDNYAYNYYFTDNWSPEMYEKLAFAGFISVSINDNSGNAYLIPEIQFSYAVLHWENLHVSRRLKSFIAKKVFHDNNYYLSINKDTSAVFDGIKKYHDSENWMTAPYINILKSFINSKQKYKLNLISVELWHNEKLIGGEIGYLIGGIYTSLTGFFDRKNYSNFGKVQLLSLAVLLKKSNLNFWNMGHPYMNYKFDMGAIAYKRHDFLKFWMKYREENIDLSFTNKLFKCEELLKEIV
ncbi:Leucyl/phenylalanyl-tRNA-protein transferase [Candidatus Magnetomorum sp. HK-1]|nr:Leucyl/phenylalanyl-tRNA-protein transferase [Candidatus Magnetomorum sp. HK-1]